MLAALPPCDELVKVLLLAWALAARNPPSDVAPRFHGLQGVISRFRSWRYT